MGTRERVSAYYGAAGAVATVRRGLSLPSPAAAESFFSPLARRAPTSLREKLAARLVVLLAGYAALVRLGIDARHARAQARDELEQARKISKRLGLTEAMAFARSRRFVASRRNWKAIEFIAGELWFHAYELAQLKRWHAREIGLWVDIVDGRRMPERYFDRHGLGPSLPIHRAERRGPHSARIAVLK